MKVIALTRVRNSKNFVRFEEQHSELIAGKSVYVNQAFVADQQCAVVVGTAEELEKLMKSPTDEPVAPPPSGGKKK